LENGIAACMGFFAFLIVRASPFMMLAGSVAKKNRSCNKKTWF
jgi:hypothetical protein